MEVGALAIPIPSVGHSPQGIRGPCTGERTIANSMACHGQRLTGSSLVGATLSSMFPTTSVEGWRCLFVQWHRDALLATGFVMEEDIEVPTARLRYGANHAFQGWL